jgi:glycosyltransferase involved in cell wall biosynthesis
MVETKRAPSLQPQLTTELVTNVAGSPVDVSVVIPCLNEANSLGICVEKAQKAFADAGLRGEVVVADNGSTDGSIDIAEKLGARVIPVAQRGYGSALKGTSDGARRVHHHGRRRRQLRLSATCRGSLKNGAKGNEVVMGNRFSGEIKPERCPGTTNIWQSDRRRC